MATWCFQLLQMLPTTGPGTASGKMEIKHIVIQHKEQEMAFKFGVYINIPNLYEICVHQKSLWWASILAIPLGVTSNCILYVVSCRNEMVMFWTKWILMKCRKHKKQPWTLSEFYWLSVVCLKTYFTQRIHCNFLWANVSSPAESNFSIPWLQHLRACDAQTLSQNCSD